MLILQFTIATGTSGTVYRAGAVICEAIDITTKVSKINLDKIIEVSDKMWSY